jgi:hypothetical protein
LNAVKDIPSFFSGAWNSSPFLTLTNPDTGGSWKQYVEGTFIGTGNDTLIFTFRDDPGYIALDNVVVSQ